MKKNIFTLLVTSMLAGSILAGCGENEASNHVGISTEINVNTEVTVNKEGDSSLGAAQISPDIEYKETAIAFLFAKEEDIDKTLVDGSDVPNTIRENVEYTVKVNAPADLYNKGKERIGYLKEGMTIAYVQIDTEWCIIGSTDYSEIYYALAVDMMPIIEFVETTEIEAEIESANVMSERAKEYFEKIRQGVADVNKEREAFAKEHPDVPYTEIIEAGSFDGMECLGTVAGSYDNERGPEDIVDAIIYENNGNNTQYYLEYIKETENYVEFKLYVK